MTKRERCQMMAARVAMLLIFLALTSCCNKNNRPREIQLFNSVPIEDMKTTGLSSEVSYAKRFKKINNYSEYIQIENHGSDTAYSILGYNNTDFYVTLDERSTSINFLIEHGDDRKQLTVFTESIEDFKPIGIIKRDDHFLILLFFNKMYNIMKFDEKFSNCRWSNYEFL